MKFNDGRTLIGTEDHKIYSDKGFIYMKDYRKSYKPLDTIGYVWKNKTKFLEDIDTIKKKDIGKEQKETPKNTYIEKYGKKKMEKSPKDIIYTIKTKINQITELKTSRYFLQKNTQRNTGQKKGQKNKKNGVIKLDHSQKNGIEAKKEETGIRNIGKNILKNTLDQKPNIVKYVERNLKTIQAVRKQNIAQINASQKHLELKTLKKLKNIKGKVYDLMVQDQHEFFANGILVHNCIDAGRYSLEVKYNQSEFGVGGTNWA